MTRDDTDETSKFNKLFDIISFDSVRHISHFELEMNGIIKGNH